MIIKLENINKSYQLGSHCIQVLYDINLSIDAGEFVSIMGPSGSGKSTLLNILGCLDLPSSGRYLLNDHDTSHLSENELSKVRSRLIGFIFQRFHLIDRLDLIDNVCLPMMFAGLNKDERKDRAIEALKKVGLGHRLNHKTNEISGGESQRVAIARAVVMSPKILFADEPTGNLDSKVGQEILDMIKQFNQEGLTVLLVTHDTYAGEQAKRHIRLKDGRIVEDS